MADAARDKEEFSDLIQRLVESLTAISKRLPFDIDSQKLRSVTTFAALSVAIVFIWKLLKAPPQPQRRQTRRRNSVSGPSGARSHSNTSSSLGEVCSSSDSRAQDAVDEFFRPVKLSLEQLIRHKLEGRKVTCQLLGVILEETSPEELQQKRATVKSSVLEVLLEITKFCDLYLMERVLDDKSEVSVLSALDDAGLFTAGGLIKDKVLFCSTENGRSSFVRQLEPDWHIDTNPEIIHQLSRFIKHLLLISPSRPEAGISSNVFSSASLEQFFGGPGGS